jgi:predicted RNA-binding Zn-ribbon protein involved in translation (DUF1610 family)
MTNSHPFSREAGVLDRRDSMCSRCPDTRAIATSTEIGAGIQTIQFRCPSCGQQWTVRRAEKEPVRVV